jgi:hypothetical protein
MHPKDSQVGIYLWDLEDLDWRRLTLSDLQGIFSAGQNFSQRFDYDGNGNVEYIGYAVPGISIYSPAWKIIKLSYDGNNNVTSRLFASGSCEFAFIWNSKEGYTYS